MPTYQYSCTECGEQVEAVQKFTDDPLTVCEACGGKLRKVFFPAGIVFKGSGFYRTDSRNGSKSASTSTAAKDKQAIDAAASSSSSSSSDSKPADKPAAKSETSSPSKPPSGEKAA